jgi:hypothetical protein
MSLMPCFKSGEAFDEGVILGRLLAGYGELELQMCSCLIAAEGTLDRPIKVIFGKTGAERRIKIVERALKTDFTNAGLLPDLMQALTDLNWCRKIRNQYSHCHWYWTTREGLCFVNLQELPKHTAMIMSLTTNMHSIDVPLLTAQEDYFWYVKECFMYLESAYRAWDQARSRGSAPGPPIHIYPKPAAKTPPPKHN